MAKPAEWEVGTVKYIYAIMDFIVDNFSIPEWLPLVISLVTLAVVMMNQSH
ncbi:MAG: hypothetical protein ABFC57_12665 [Veillonellales bacterium]